ncbi:hypothetical protein, partial [uncultured Limnobacter sp.]|uniref:hypothetical protein n=1 Tax=uncultured Limnobacter sp. TaxID=199681 RepID=UPI0030FB58B0
GGFLEVRPKQSHCRVGLNRRQRLFNTAQLTAVQRPIGGGVSIASPSRKPALACRAGPVSPGMGDRERARPAF